MRLPICFRLAALLMFGSEACRIQRVTTVMYVCILSYVSFLNIQKGQFLAIKINPTIFYTARILFLIANYPAGFPLMDYKVLNNLCWLFQKSMVLKR